MASMKETRLLYCIFATLLLALAGCAAPEPQEEVTEAVTPPAAGTTDLSSTTPPPPEDDSYVSLFNGENLDGWSRHMDLPDERTGGKWEVIDGVIVGDQDPPGWGGFLITDGVYRDFIVRMETNLDYPSDSGVFLRVGPDGKSHQVTLDNRPNGSIGSIYLPWTQASVYSNPEGEKHFRQGEWNDLVVQIQGEPAHIQFWLNGVLVTDFQHTEETTRGVPTEGHVGLQVHPGDWEEGVKVRFRNIRIKELN